jgi:hypothetical protein
VYSVHSTKAEGILYIHSTKADGILYSFDKSRRCTLFIRHKQRVSSTHSTKAEGIIYSCDKSRGCTLLIRQKYRVYGIYHRIACNATLAPSFNLSNITEWFVLYTSWTTEEAPWEMFGILSNVDQFAYHYVTVSRILHIRNKWSSRPTTNLKNSEQYTHEAGCYHPSLRKKCNWNAECWVRLLETLGTHRG